MAAVFDADWHRQALAGDDAAVTALVDHALGPLYGFCLHRVGGDRHLCEEVVQETLLRALRTLKDYQPERSHGEIFRWLSGLARNEIRRSLAQERWSARWQSLWTSVDRQLLAELARLDAQPLTDELLDRAETGQLVNAALAQLPPNYRETLTAKYLHGASVRDIAAARRTSEKAVESLLTRARQAFRTAFVALTTAFDADV